MNNVLSLAYATGAALGALLAIALLWRKYQSRQRLVLASLISLVTLDIVLEFAKQASINDTGVLRAIPIYAGLIFAPLLLHFLCRQDAQQLPLRRRFLGTLPFIVIQGITVTEVWFSASLPWLTINTLLNSIAAIVLAVYLVQCVRLAMLPQSQESEWFEFHNRSIAQGTLINIVLCYSVISGVRALVDPSSVRTTVSVLYGVIACSLIVLTYSFLYKAISHGQSEEVASAGKEKYGNNRLPDFVRDLIISSLKNYMCSNKPWLKYDLTLAELADSVNVNPHHLSQIINSHFGKSFACFINEYRVNAACELFASDNNKSILDIALASGFSSKSSFNTLFKKQTGLTPSEYRKKVRRADSVAA